MRILICAEVYPSLSGIAQHIKNISKILKKKNKITIICSKEPEKKVSEKIKGIKIKRISYNEIENFMKQNSTKFDLVLVGWYIYVLNATKYFSNVAYILPSVRAISLKFLNNQGETTTKISERINLEKEGIKNCKYIIYPSLTIKKQVEQEYKIKKGEVIPHGINLNEFKPGKNKIYDVLTIANFDPRKGIDKLIKTAKFSKANFIVLGDGTLREDYTKLISKFKLKKKIKLLGKKKNVSDYLKKSKIYVLPSRYESFGLVLLEAMASGLPCIAFKPDGEKIITASDEIIKNGETGFLVKDEKEMAEKIDLLLSDDELREKMSKEAYKESKKYSSKKEVEKILKLIKK
ncbi:glycosyltransferase family 4 protein [Candidatus Pacearchaeota archaeon]|nr:glycosyltransferase family 4 protein [Candidatus Pacearchaeota archaeon]